MFLAPYSLKDEPSLIEHLLPVQKISAESYKEQMAGSGKALTALGNYWKGRKPLILNKACILGALLPYHKESEAKDLEIFELLMGMANSSVAIRLGEIKPEIVAFKVSNLLTEKYFKTSKKIPSNYVFYRDIKVDLPSKTPFNIQDYTFEIKNKKTGEIKEISLTLSWASNLSSEDKFEAQGRALPYETHKENITDKKALRPEEIEDDKLYSHVWKRVNAHLGTNAFSIPELINELGIARFGHNPKVADTFCGSGQIPFEAARLGCDVYASDLNPIACMLTWGAFNIVGIPKIDRKKISDIQEELTQNLVSEIDSMGIESDGNGWQAKVFLYCNEVICPETGYKVPLLPTFIVSKPKYVVAKLEPDHDNKCYNIKIEYLRNPFDLDKYELGTVQNGYLVHSPDEINTYRTSISSIRGDFKDENGINHNKLRLWEKSDFMPKPDDIFQERLYCIQWMKQRENSSLYDYEFRSVTKDDLKREEKVNNYVREHLAEWQEKGVIPDMVIEKGDETERLYREKGWTHWHHLFNPRQLLMNGIINSNTSAYSKSFATKVFNYDSKLCVWHKLREDAEHTFLNQALNTLFNYVTRSSKYIAGLINKQLNFKEVINRNFEIENHLSKEISTTNDIYVTDPPYGDAVKYEEILEFFIAWLRKNPPKEFSNWVWDSRRALAIKGEGDEFKREMIAAYKAMKNHSPDNGIHILMFTHQSGSIWAEMANIIWASGLRVTVAWYVVTETDSALRQGANVKGTIILVLRKRIEEESTFREYLAEDIEKEVENQIKSMSGLDKEIQSQGAEALYNDADLQMAGYAAALKVLTRYSNIDGKDMVAEAEAPRIEGRKTFVDELIEFAVQLAVKFLVPVGFESDEWMKFSPIERYYFKMAEMESRGYKTLDNYQNFAKAYKVMNFSNVLSPTSKANSTRLALGIELKTQKMSGDPELSNTLLRPILYAIYEASEPKEEENIDIVLEHLSENLTHEKYFSNRAIIVKIFQFLADKRKMVKPAKNYKVDVEANFADLLAESILNQRI